MTTEHELADVLGEAIECEESVADAFQAAGVDAVDRVVSFRDAGVLTTNAGIVIRLEDGSEFQLQIIRSR